MFSQSLNTCVPSFNAFGVKVYSRNKLFKPVAKRVKTDEGNEVI